MTTRRRRLAVLTAGALSVGLLAASSSTALSPSHAQKLDGELLADFFGADVDIDGDRAIVGARAATGVLTGTGEAYVYTQADNGTWGSKVSLAAPDGQLSDLFGSDVAIDGKVAVAGAPADSEGGLVSGSASVFVRNAGGAWSHRVKLTASDAGTLDEFGRSVDVSGKRVVVGAPGNDEGAVYVYVRSGGTWVEEQKITRAGGVDGDDFGTDVAIDGNRLVVGAPGVGLDAGAAYVYRRTGSTWNLEGTLTASNADTGDGLGDALAIDGTTVAAGVRGAGSGGRAYVFARSGGAWSQQAELDNTEAELLDAFGASIDVDGDSVVVGAPGDDNGLAVNQGEAVLFTRTGTSWAQEGAVLRGSGALLGGLVGTDVALDAGTIIAGSPTESLTAGSIYIFADGVSLDYAPTALTVGQAATITPTIAGENGGVSYAAENLPRGLSIATGTGVISGTPRRAGTTTVRITATDDDGPHPVDVELSIGHPAIDLATDPFYSAEGATAGDETGRRVAAAGDVNGDGVGDLIIGAAGADPSGRADAGAAWVVYGGRASGTLDLDAITPADGFRIAGASAGDDTGAHVAGVGDVNADGLADLAVGPVDTVGFDGVGIIFGSAAPVDIDLATDAPDVLISGFDSGSGAGPVAAAGDVNGDGVADILIGDRLSDTGGPNAGAAYVVYGSGGLSGSISLGSLDPATTGLTVEGGAAGQQLGARIAAASDVDGDGADDIVLGSAGDGSAHVVFGTPSGGSPADVDLASAGDAANSLTGLTNATEIAVDGAGDVNDDGLADVVVGDPAFDGTNGTDSGAGFVVYGSTTRADVDLSGVTGDATGFRVDGEAAGDALGTAVAGGVDLNRDGRDDPAFGAPRDPGSDEGRAWVVFGDDLAAQVDLAALGAAGVRVDGAATGDGIGTELLAADVTGDGAGDLSLGAPEADPSARADAGAVATVGAIGTSLSYRTPNLGLDAPATLDPLVTDAVGATSFVATGLPAGLGIDGDTGVISGTPTSSGSSDVSVTMTDDLGDIGAELTIVVASSPPSYGLDNTIGPLPVDVAMTPVTPSVTAAGDTSFSATGLPPGLAIDADDGEISGTPTASGDYEVTVTMVDDLGPVAVAVDITVLSALDYGTPGPVAVDRPITPITVSTSPVGDATFSATGLPAGLAIDASTGTISGTPTATGTSSVTVSMTDDLGTSQDLFDIEVVVSTAPDYGGTSFAIDFGVAMTPLTATSTPAGSVSFAATGLPTGLAIDSSTATISGTPTSPGPHDVTVTMTDDTGDVDVEITITVSSAFGYDPAPLVRDQAMTPISPTEAPVGPPTYTQSGLPTGVAIDSDTGEISGTPTVSGRFVVDITRTDNLGPDEDVIILTVSSVPPTYDPDPLPVNTAITPLAPTASPTGTPAYAASGLPAGLAIDAGDGTISGTPTTPGSSNVTVTMTDDNGAAPTTFTLTVLSAPPAYTDPDPVNPGASLPALSPTASPSGVTTWTASGLPAGVSIDATSGVISGNPSASGIHTAAVTMTDENGAVGTTVTIRVLSAPPSYPGATPTAGEPAAPMAPTSSPTGTARYSATGLPPGMGINATTGVISGTATTPGTFPVTVRMTDDIGSVARSFTIVVAAPAGPPVEELATAAACRVLPTPKPVSKPKRTVKLSVLQLRTNQRIAQTAILRLDAIERWLSKGIRARDLCGNSLGHAEFGDSVGLSVGPDAGAAGRATPRPLDFRTAKKRKKVKLTRGQLLTNWRIARVSLARANALQAKFNGRITGANVIDRTLTGDKFARRLVATPAGTQEKILAPSRVVKQPRRPKAGVKLTAAQMRVNQRLSQLALKRANAIIRDIQTGLTEDNFLNGSITAEDLAP